MRLMNFLVNEQISMNQGLAKTNSIYLLEEIANRPGTMRATLFCQVSSEEEGRNRLKKFISLRTMLSLIDRKGAPVGCLAEITDKAKQIATNGVEVVTEEEDEDMSGDDSQRDDGIESVKGDIEPEAGMPFEEAKNEPVEEEKKKETIIEDLTTPTKIWDIEDVPDWEERMNLANYNDA